MKGSIKEYRPGRFYVRFFYGGKEYKLSRYEGILLTSKELAEMLLSSVRTDVNRTGVFDPTRYTKKRKQYIFSEAWEKYIETKKGEHRRVLSSYFKNHFMQLYSRDIREIRTITIADTVKSFTVSRRGLIRTLRAFLAWCYKQYDLDGKFPQFPETEEPAHREQTLSWEEQEKVINHSDEFYKLVFRIGFLFGTRPIELRNMVWGDVDFRAGLVTIRHSKTEKRGVRKTVFKVEDYVLNMFRSIPRSIGNEYIFHGKDGRQLERCILTKVWINANEKSDVKRVTLYEAMRHSWGSNHINEGKQIEIVSAGIGHTDIRVTMKNYIHVSPATLGKLVKMREGK